MIIKIYILQKYISLIFGPRRDKTCLQGFANNKNKYQPAHSDQRLGYSLIGKYHIETCCE